MHTVIVPLDGSAAAESVLPTAAGVARRLKSRLVLLSVYDPPAIPYPPALLWGGEAAASVPEEVSLNGRRELQEALEQAAKLVKDADASLEVETVLLEGPVAPMIAEYAEDNGARLIVMATHGYGGFSRVWLGNVADHLIRHSTASILLMRPLPLADFQKNLGEFKRVLIPLAENSYSEQIVSVATQLAGREDVGYTLFRVLPPISPAVQAVASREELEQMSSSLRAQADQQLSRLEQGIWANGYDADSQIRVSGHVAQSILQYVTDNDIDLIAMATHGKGALGRLLVGSVTDKIIRGTNVPVLVRRLPDDFGNMDDSPEEVSL